jgi:hypothetical protein
MDLPILWERIRTGLARARQKLPSNVAEHDAIRQYKEFLNHSELKLTFEMFESYTEKHSVGAEFWIALRDAAEKMELCDRAGRYQEFSNKR